MSEQEINDFIENAYDTVILGIELSTIEQNGE